MENVMQLRHNVWEIRKKIKNKKTLSKEIENDMLDSLEKIEGKLEAAESELRVPGGVLKGDLKAVLSKLGSFIQGDQNEEDAKSILEILSPLVKQENSLIKPLEEVVSGGINVQQIIEMTLKSDNDHPAIWAIPLIGTSTTIAAQLVYHDNRVRNHFEERHWVCMCDMNHTHPSKLLDLIFRKQTSNVDILKDYRSIVNGKRYLLILDGITQAGLGFFLEDLLRDIVRPGSKIILTASSKDTLEMLEPLKTQKGAPIEPDAEVQEKEAWDFLEPIAFKDKEKESNQILLGIGKEISSKYAGAPGLLKTIAFILSSKHTVQEWENFRDNLITSLQDLSENNLLKFNLMTYEELHLKIPQYVCYLSLFPKDYEFCKTNLIHLWTSQDYLSTETGRPEELVGDEYFEELLNNGYLSEITSCRDGVAVEHSYKIHYILDELLKTVEKPQCCLVEEPTREIDTANILHVCFTVEGSWEAPSWLLNAGKLQSLIFLPSKLHYPVNVSDLEGVISKLTWLQALDLVAVNCENLSHSLGDLKHLRYLRLGVSSKLLPESITKLQNLLTLDLRQSSVTLLPSEFYKLSHLRHLYTGGRLIDMPPKFGELKSLQTLDVFIVGNNNRIDVLADLSDLVGKLIIRYEKPPCHGVALETGDEGILKNMNVTDLSLVWSSSYSKTPNLEEFDYLQPPHGLRSLAVYHWKGAKFPLQLMFGMAVFDRLVSIHIEDCRGCKDLPAVSSLPHLRSIQLWDLNVLEYVEPNVDNGNITGSGSSTLRHYFPSLEYLLLANLPRLEGWSRKIQQQHPISSRTLTLCVSNCPKMSSMPLLRSLVSLEAHDIHVKLLNHLLSTTAGPSPSATLRKLEIVSVSELMSTFSIKNLNALQSLAIRRCPDLKEVVLGSLTSLQRLEIHECNGLVDITVGNMDQLSALETLEIKRCEKLKLLNSSGDWKCFNSLRFLKLTSIFNLESLKNGLCSLHKLEGLSLYSIYELRSLPDWIGDLRQLRSLTVRNCPFLITLSESLGSLSTLQQLEIHCCPKLKEIPKSFADLKSLQKLVIQRCPKLFERCQMPDEPDFSLIQHVPYRDIRKD